MKKTLWTLTLILTTTAALAGGAGPRPATFTCSDGSVIRATYKPDRVLLTVTKGRIVEKYQLEALRPSRYGDAEHTWLPNGKTAEFAIGAAGDKVLSCRARSTT